MNRLHARVGVALLALSAASIARAEGWKSHGEQKWLLSELAHKHGFTPASQYTIDRLNGRFGSHLQGGVYYTTWSRFSAFVDEAQNHLVGVGSLDHGVGPHGYLAVGNRLRDSIDPMFKESRFHENGKKTRDQDLRRHHSSAMLFSLWHAPTEFLTLVGVNSDNAVKHNQDCGLNCVAMVNGNLWSAANHFPARDPSNPFADLRPDGWPHEGAESVLRLTPPMIVQVLPEASYNDVRSNHDHHLIKPWRDAY
jgi:hypothetical protein